MRDSDNQQQDIAQLSQDTDNAHSTLNKIFDKEKEQNRQQKQQLVGEIGAQIIDLATTVDTIRGTNIAKDESTLNRLSDTAYDDIYQALSETNDNVTERDVQNYLFQQRLQDYTNQSDFGTGGKYTRAIQAVTAFTQGIMGGNIVTAIANGSAPYLANEVKNQIQGNSVESDIQRTLAHGLVNAGLALAKGENAAAQAAGAMTGETMGILSHSLYGKTPEELTESEKQNISAWATLASGIVGGLISDNSAGVANAAQAGKVVVENNWLSTNQLDNFAHQARNCVGDECQKIIRDMVDTNILQQEEIKQICSTSPEQCKQQYGYLVEQWNVFDRVIKHLAADKSLPDEFRDYLPAVYMLSMDATGITVEHKWAKRLEAMGLEPEAANLIAMALPGMINGGSGKGKGTTDKQTSISAAKQLNVSKDKFISPENPGITQSRVNVANVTFDNGKIRGFGYAMGKHGIDANVPNKSRFTVTNNEVKELLQRPDIVNKPVYNPIQIGGKVETDKFVRQVDIGKSIGVDQSGKSTSVITIITDKKGNLINAFPGAL